MIRRNNGTEEIRQGNPLERLKEYYSEFDIVKENEELSFSGGLVGNLGYDFVRYSEIDLKGVSRDMADDILNILLTEGKVVRVTEEMYTLAEYMEQAKEKIKAHLADDPLITIAQVRDMFGTSRKSAKPILEYMDALKITKKMGAESERVAY